MFDKLVESEPEGAEFKNRRRYFLVSSVIVGIFFVTAVVISIFAADYGLGSNGLELAELLPPAEMAATAPEPQPRQQPAAPTRTTSDVPTRQINMARTDEAIAPTSISTSPNTQASRPNGDFKIGKVNAESGDPGGTGREIGGSGTSTDAGPGLSEVKNVPEEKDNMPPPPVIKKREEPRKTTVSKGVLNGEAKSLPKPAYSAAAKAVRAQGKVTVQVTIDETGSVISAHAIDGNPLLRADAEKAARGARFSPTFLSEVPVKVTGIITYNFIL